MNLVRVIQLVSMASMAILTALLSTDQPTYITTKPLHYSLLTVECIFYVVNMCVRVAD